MLAFKLQDAPAATKINKSYAGMVQNGPPKTGVPIFFGYRNHTNSAENHFQAADLGQKNRST